MINFSAVTTTDAIAIFAMGASICSAIYAWRSTRNARAQFEAVEAREQRHYESSELRENEVHLAANYLALETSSSDIFKYTADNETKIADIRGAVGQAVWSAKKHSEARGILINLYYQSLNLFEVCARFRRKNMIRTEVFASWIAWMVEILEDDYFRAHWGTLIRSNYTRDVRDIFDVGVEIFEEGLPLADRDQAFYEAVAEIMGGCEAIANWLIDSRDPARWSELDCSSKYLSRGTSQAA